MIDLNKIRSIKTLENIQADLKAFLASEDVPNVYVTNLAWSLDDYEADKEMVMELLDRVDRRIRSLSNFLMGKSKKPDSQSSPETETVITPEVQ